MTSATSLLTEDQKFDLFFRITKVDIPQRQVWGRATQEVRDGVREIYDYDTSKPYMQKWSADARARTAFLPPEDQSLGNMREMHKPIAAGKVIDLSFNDMEKAVDIGTVCVDDSTWDKVLKGVLTGFSLGGEYIKRWPDPRNPGSWRYTANPNEISYVDSPAVPTAVFSLVKMDGSTEVRKLGDAVLPPDNDKDQTPEPGWNNPGPDPADLNTVAQGLVEKVVPAPAGSAPSPDLIRVETTAKENTQATPLTAPIARDAAPTWVVKFSEAVNKVVNLAKASADEKAQAEALLKAVGTRVGIARKDRAPLTPREGQPADLNAYGDPANFAWVYESADQVQKAISFYNSGVSKDQYEDREWNVLGRRIAVRATKLFGANYQYRPALKTIISSEVQKTMPTLTELQKVDVNAAIGQLQSALGVLVDKLGSDPDALQDLLLSAVGNVSSAANSASSVGTDTSSSSPSSAPQGSQAGLNNTVMKATPSMPSSPPSSPSSPSSPSTPPPPPNTTKATPAGTGTPGAGSSTGSSAPTMSSGSGLATGPSQTQTGSGTGDTATAVSPDRTPPVFKDEAIEDLKKQVATLTEMVKAHFNPPSSAQPVATQPAATQPAPSGTPEPVHKNLPAGSALAQLLGMSQPAADDTLDAQIVKIMESGDKYAYLKAAQLAGGGPDKPDFAKVNQVVDKQIKDTMTPLFTGLMLKHGFGPLNPLGDGWQ